MQHIGFTNFRRFRKFPNMNFGDITLLVGSNNSGKSTIIKALMLVFDNLRNLKVTKKDSTFGDNVFRFHGYNMHNIHIDTYWRALNNEAKEEKENEISFNIGFGDFSICINVTGNKTDLADSIIKSIIISNDALGITFFISFEKSYVQVDFPDEFEESIVEDKDIKKQIDDLQSSLKTVSSPIEAAEINSKIDNLKGSLNVDLISSVMAYVGMDEISEFMKPGENLLISCLNSLIEYSRHPTMGDSGDERYKKVEQQKSLLRNNEKHITDSVDALKAMLNNKPLEYVFAHGVVQKAVFSIEDKNDYTAQAIYQFVDQKINPGSEEYSLVTEWMQKFEVGADFRIDTLRGTAYGVKIFNDMDDFEGVELADKGMGSNQLMILLWRMASFIRLYKNLPKKLMPTIIIEEPEQNLHPKIQSLLADFFLYINIHYGFRFIIETHSEYLVRKSQVLVGSKDFHSQEELDSNNPFKVYYLPINREAYEMKYTVSGLFDNKKTFDDGFFDEASRHQLTLIKNSRRR